MCLTSIPDGRLFQSPFVQTISPLLATTYLLSISYTQSILLAYSVPNLPVLIVCVCCCIRHVEMVVSELIPMKENPL